MRVINVIFEKFMHQECEFECVYYYLYLLSHFGKRKSYNYLFTVLKQMKSRREHEERRWVCKKLRWEEEIVKVEENTKDVWTVRFINGMWSEKIK